MKLGEKLELICQTLISTPNEINLEHFNWKQLKKISSVLCDIFAIIWFFILIIISSIINKIKGYNYDIEVLFIFSTIIVIFTALYLKYLVINAKEEYKKRQEERDDYFAKYKINFNKSAENFSVKEVETALNSHLYNDSSLCEQLKGKELQSFLDGIYYTFCYLLETKESHFEWPYSPIIKQRKCHFEENESFVKQIMDYGIRQLEEADKRNSKK